MRIDLRAAYNVVRFRDALMATAGALITTKYEPISPLGTGGVGSFCRFQPAGILSEQGPFSPAFLSPNDASVWPRIGGVMGAHGGALLRESTWHQTRNSISEYDKAGIRFMNPLLRLYGRDAEKESTPYSVLRFSSVLDLYAR